MEIHEQYIYAAVDTLSNSYHLAGRNIQNGATNIFLDTDPSTHVQTLTKRELVYVITGGFVTGCSWKLKRIITLVIKG